MVNGDGIGPQHVALMSLMRSHSKTKAPVLAGFERK